MKRTILLALMCMPSMLAAAPVQPEYAIGQYLTQRDIQANSVKPLDIASLGQLTAVVPMKKWTGSEYLPDDQHSVELSKLVGETLYSYSKSASTSLPAYWVTGQKSLSWATLVLFPYQPKDSKKLQYKYGVIVGKKLLNDGTTDYFVQVSPKPAKGQTIPDIVTLSGSEVAVFDKTKWTKK